MAGQRQPSPGYSAGERTPTLEWCGQLPRYKKYQSWIMSSIRLFKSKTISHNKDYVFNSFVYKQI